MASTFSSVEEVHVAEITQPTYQRFLLEVTLNELIFDVVISISACDKDINLNACHMV